MTKKLKEAARFAVKRSLKAMHILNVAMLVAFVFTSGHAVAAPPSHCKLGEFSVVDAWMGKVNATESGWRNSRSGKFLSLCADKKIEPFSTLTYRYGALGQVEFEVTATERSKFNIASIQTSPHTGDDLVFFKKGSFTYYIAIATGQGHGVTLSVFEGNKKITEHFSGNGDGEDFHLGPAEIDFISRSPISPVMVKARPKHDELFE